jgi:hypothetical protein
LAQRPNLPPHQSSEHQVEIGDEIRLACTSGSRMGTHHEQATSGQRGKAPAHKFPEPSLYPVANHRRANRTADNKAYLRTDVLGYGTFGRQQQMPGEGSAAGPSARAHHAPELLRAPHPRLLRQHDPSCQPRRALSDQGSLTRGGPQAAASDGDVLAALAAARGKDGAASTGTHALTETVDLGPAAVIRLERALAHWNSRSIRKLRCLMKADMPCVARPGASLDRHGGTADVARVSLLTVRAILAQVKLSFSGLPSGNTAISTTDLSPAT